jgi:FtsP/CotA-like multicopper oxidase with cupredoxin domain
MGTRSIGLLLAGALAASGCSRGGDGGGGPGTLEVPDFQRGAAFAGPSELRAENGVLRVTLHAARGGTTVGGLPVTGETWNGGFVGPTLRLRPGDRLEVTLVNDLAQPTNLHFHGLHVSPEGDGDNVFRHVRPGETARYVIQLPPNHERGTFWYHSHLHTLAEEQVFGGLSGVLIVDGLEDALPEPFRAIPDRTFALKDLQVEAGAILSADINSDAPTTRTVNALVEPVLATRPGATELWRLANIGADIFYDARLDGHTFLVLAEDGNPVEQLWTADHLVLPPGKRFDVLVQFGPAGDYVLRSLAYNQHGDKYPDEPLARVEVGGPTVAPAPLPSGPFAPPFAYPPVVGARTKVFTEDDKTSVFRIDGKEFDENRVDDVVRLNTSEEWTLRNQTGEQHPFHIHVNDFRVLSVNGQPVETHGRQDTVVLPPQGEVVVLIPFTDFPGKFVYHCHILNHEDNGMMAAIGVIAP